MAKVKISINRCKGCGLCVLYCPVKHLEFSQDLNSQGVKYAKEKPQTLCIGCGKCYLVCPDCCIEVYEVISPKSMSSRKSYPKLRRE